jgi:hypothetical protein
MAEAPPTPVDVSRKGWISAALVALALAPLSPRSQSASFTTIRRSSGETRRSMDGSPTLVFRLLARGVSVIAAAIGAAWFAVHPIHVEAIASVANSSEILVALFTGALALIVARTTANDGRPSSRSATMAALVYLLACVHQMVTVDSASYRGYWLLALDARARRHRCCARVARPGVCAIPTRSPAPGRLF